MKKNTLLRISSIFFLTLCCSPCSAADHRCRISEESYEIGEGRVLVREHRCGKGGLTIFNMHDDEDTAVDASLKVIRQNGGRLVELSHSGERLVSFNLGNETFRFDPNRIFTSEGLKATLERYGRYTRPAFDQVASFASALLEDYRLMEGELIITAHNNGASSYSASSYLPGAQYENDAGKVYIEEGSDPDDFFFVTVESAFEDLKGAGFNVVLQDNRTVSDDGSLSVLAGRRGIPYINCEAEHGHLEEQVDMLEFLWEISPGSTE